MKNDRLFQLLYLLLEKKRISAPKLAKNLEVSVRTVYRDVETLSMAGVPIFASAGKGGGISILPGYSFNKTLLTDDEQNQLIFAVQSLKAVDQKVDGLLNKLGAAFQKTKADWIAVDFSRWGLQRTDTLRFELIKTAILGKHVLDIVYCSTSGETKQRKLNPIKLIYKDKNWYLQAYCLKADDFRLFKICRIVEIYLTNEVFNEDYTYDVPPIESQQTTNVLITLIRLKFSQSVAFRVYDEFSSDTIKRQADGSLIVNADFPLDDWIISYLFSFGTDVTVLEPLNLNKKLADYAEKVVEHYKT